MCTKIGTKLLEDDKCLIKGITTNFGDKYKQSYVCFDNSEELYINSSDILNKFLKDTGVKEQDCNFIYPLKVNFMPIPIKSWTIENSKEWYLGNDKKYLVSKFVNSSNRRPKLLYTSIVVSGILGLMILPNLKDKYIKNK